MPELLEPSPQRPVLPGSLSFEQQRAALHGVGEPGHGAPLLIIAGAGSGKTQTLATRVAHLIARGADPQRLLLMTFSRRAAAELERRAGQILEQVLKLPLGARPATLPWAGTFHSVGARLLRDYAPRIGLADSFTIHDRADAADMMGLARADLGLSQTKNRFPAKDTCLAIYSRVVNSQAPLERVLAGHFPWCAPWEAELKKLFSRYVAAKQAQHVLDLDDLLLYWAEMVDEPSLGAEIGARFAHILVDEYQDTNRLQAAILLALKPTGEGLTVVGDDAQSIYSFRAADVRNILDFPKQFTPPAALITLERNYRSTPAILSASNAIIGLAEERFTKNLWSDRVGTEKPALVTVQDESDQARYVAEEVLAQRECGVLLRAQAVLFRSASHSAPLELELARRNIPFVKFGGLKFLEAAHVKDLLALLRWAENPRGRMAGFRVIQLLPGVGPATASRVLDALESVADLEHAMAALRSIDVPSGVAPGWLGLIEALEALRSGKAGWPAEFERARLWYEPHLERLFEDAGARRQDLEQLGRIAATFATRERFITELALDPPAASSAQAGVPGRDDDYLILSTIHSAKGQEWSAVTILNVVDGCIPSDMATGSSEEIEEERRLLYVAMTRAKDSLQLVMPQRFYVHQQCAFGDRHVYALPSRFVPDAIHHLFEVAAWPREGLAQAPTNAAPVPVTRDVGKRLQSRWD